MRWRASMVSLLLLMASTACGDESTSSGTDATTTSTVESIEPSALDDPTLPATDPPPPTTSQADETSPTTELPPTTPTPPTSAESTTALPTTEESVAAACTSDVILPVVAAVFPDNEFWNILEVDVLECQNGYARVIAFADQSVCDPEFPNCLENEQLFLVDVGGSWQYLEAGTGIECNNSNGLSPELIVACEALGLT